MPPFRLVAALLAVVLLLLAAGPAAAGAADALRPDCCAGHEAEGHAPCLPSETSDEESPTTACCTRAPATPHEAAVVPAPPAALRDLAVWTAVPDRTRRAAAALLLNSSPPPTGRRHLVLSVLLI